jgi:Fe-S-cluster-containing dehydrogenase component
MGEKRFLIDADKCTACQLCVVACKDEHVGSAYAPWTKPQPETGHFWIDVLSQERGRIPRVRVTHMPLMCQHCANAPCTKACPEGAIKTRPDGLVWIDPAACTGCGLCREACPYDVIYMNDELGIAQKCTGCAHRVDEGALPRCAEICPHDAIIFGEDTDSPFRQADRPLETYHPEYQAQPRVYWKGLPQPWIAGTVIDAVRDEVIAGATVTATDLFENHTFTVLSDAFGDFWIKNLAPGRKYRVEIKNDGCESVLAVVTTEGDQDLGTVALKRRS